jgi:hypothetical protein
MKIAIKLERSRFKQEVCCLKLERSERRRILIYDRLGIGKSAFLLEVLSVLRRKHQLPQQDVRVFAQIPLPPADDE